MHCVVVAGAARERRRAAVDPAIPQGTGRVVHYGGAARRGGLWISDRRATLARAGIRGHGEHGVSRAGAAGPRSLRDGPHGRLAVRPAATLLSAVGDRPATAAGDDRPLAGDSELSQPDPSRSPPMTAAELNPSLRKLIDAR